jgi:hypothetical protein
MQIVGTLLRGGGGNQLPSGISKPARAALPAFKKPRLDEEVILTPDSKLWPQPASFNPSSRLAVQNRIRYVPSQGAFDYAGARSF